MKEILVPLPSSSSSSKKNKFAKQAAIHNASKVAAAATKNSKRITNPSEFAEQAKMAIELEMVALSARLVLLEELSEMTDEEKMECLFRILDKNRDGNLSIVELADGLRKINGDVGFEESLELAMKRVASFDADGDAKLNFCEFKVYVTQLAEAFGSTFHDLAEMLILSVVFSDNGNNDQENLTAQLAEETIAEAVREEGVLVRVMADERTEVLFQLFDLDHDGSVDCLEVVTGLYKITDDLDSAASAAVATLISCSYDDDEGNNKNNTFDYREFTRFLVKLVAATGQTLDEVVFRMTKAAAEGDPENVTKDDLLSKLRSTEVVQ